MRCHKLIHTVAQSPSSDTSVTPYDLEPFMQIFRYTSVQATVNTFGQRPPAFINSQNNSQFIPKLIY